MICSIFNFCSFDAPLIKISAQNNSFTAPFSVALEISSKPMAIISESVLNNCNISSIFSVSCNIFTFFFKIFNSFDFKVSKIALSVPELA
ncbi:hypothetical protein ES703_88789 [subsurface metagenome]